MDSNLLQFIAGKYGTFNRPDSWMGFESLIQAIAKKIFSNPHVDRVGRNGQSQDGVDIFGVDQRNNDSVGFQCKGRNDAHFNRHLAVKKNELLDEIDKALKFKPKLDRFVFVTTGPNDVVNRPGF